MLFNEPAGDLLDGKVVGRGRRNHTLDDFQDLGLSVHTSLSDRFLVVATGQRAEVLSRLRVFNDAQQRNEDLVEPRLDGAIDQAF